MKRADIKTSFSCNNHCRFCVQGNKRELYRDRTTAAVKKILRQAREDCDEVVFTGGEVTLRQDALEVVSFARELNFRNIQIQSNGRMFYYPGFCDKIVAAGATEFALALHGHTAQLHDYLVGSKGGFKQTTSGIANLKKMGQKVIMNTVVTKPNYRYLPEVAKLLLGLGVEQFQFAFVHALGTAKENFAAIVPRMSAVEPYIKKGLDIGIKSGARVMTEAIPYCFMRGYEGYIAENIMPRTEVYDAHAVVKDFTKLRREKGKARGPLCKSCRYYGICEGPWKEYPQRYGWKEFCPVKNKEGVGR